MTNQYEKNKQVRTSDWESSMHAAHGLELLSQHQSLASSTSSKGYIITVEVTKPTYQGRGKR